MALPDVTSVLFVCTGNICRSPTAEGVFRHHVTRAGWQDKFLIDSAGTGGWHIGDAPDPRSIATAIGRGVDISAQRARQLHVDDFEKFQYLIALDETHYNHMIKMKPAGSAGQVSLLMHHQNPRQHNDVPDPYYGGQKDFDLAYDMISAGSEGLLAALSKELIK